jgi:DNA-directed RNA polymerase specialized sigma24 family protein
MMTIEADEEQLNQSLGKAIKAKFGKHCDPRDVKRIRSTKWAVNPGGRDGEGTVVALDELIKDEPYQSEDACILADNRAGFEGSLTEVEERVYTLHHVGGMSRAEVGSILGISQSGIFKAIARIRRKAQGIISTGG